MKNLKMIVYPVLIGFVMLLVACKAEYANFTPQEGNVCDTVRFTVQGHYFGHTSVYFNGVESETVFLEKIPGESGKQLAALVPGRARTGPIRIKNETGMGSIIGILSSDFTFEEAFTVLNTALPVPPVGFRSTPEEIAAGETATLSWTMPPYIVLTGLYLNGGEFVDLDVLHSYPSAITVRPSATTTYELRKELDCQTRTENATVTVRH